MPAKLSNFMKDSETRKTPNEEKILKPLTASNGQQDEGGKNMFAGAVFNNCQFIFALDGFENWRVFQHISEEKIEENLASF